MSLYGSVCSWVVLKWERFYHFLYILYKKNFIVMFIEYYILIIKFHWHMKCTLYININSQNTWSEKLFIFFFFMAQNNKSSHDVYTSFDKRKLIKQFIIIFLVIDTYLYVFFLSHTTNNLLYWEVNKNPSNIINEVSLVIL